MGLHRDLVEEVGTILSTRWGDIPNGYVVPDAKDLPLGNGGRRLSATVLYADLVGSTKMVDTEIDWVAAEIYKAFLTCAARIVKAEGGSIAAYDGDRIMAVFVGDTKNTSAVRAALKINWAMSKIIRPRVHEQYSNLSCVPTHVVGIDTSPVLVSRVGVRNDNDLVWIGRAANHAAKLCDLRVDDRRTWITGDVYDAMHESARLSGAENMWRQYTWKQMGDARIYASNWTWRID